MPTRGALVSNIKCNSHGPQGIGCCDGQAIQAPRRRGTWRDFGRASARGEPGGNRRSSGSCAKHDQSGTVAWPLRCTARASPIARSSAGQRIGGAASIADSGASWRRKLAPGGWLRDFVRGKLIHRRWSPTQIARKLKAMHPEDPTRLISHETIHAAICAPPRGGLKAGMTLALRQHKAARGLRRTTLSGSSIAPESLRIVHRPVALLHKSGDRRIFPFPGQTHPTASVTGIPSAVKPFRTATRIWNSAT